MQYTSVWADVVETDEAEIPEWRPVASGETD
jgi:hypothetical protein